MSTKSSVLYDEKMDIHIYKEFMDDFYYIDCNGAKMKITGDCADEINKAVIRKNKALLWRLKIQRY